MIQKNLLLFVCLICVFFLPQTYAETKNNPEIKVVEVEKVKQSTITETIRLLGVVKAKRSIDLVAKTSGNLEQIVQSGAKVSKGTLIAKLDNVDVEKSVALSAESAKLAKAQYDRILSLTKTNAVSKRNLEEAKHQWLDAQKSYLSAKMECGKSHYIAPFDGFVGVYKVREGTQVREGHKIVSLYDPSELGVEFDIPAKYLTKIHPGQKMVINDKQLTLDVVQNMIDPDTLMVPAYVNFSCQDCFIGETVNVDLSLVEHQNVPVISAECVFHKNGKEFVYVVKENKAILTPVWLGLKEKNKVEVTDGIQEGDIIISRGQARLYPDIQVKIDTNNISTADNFSARRQAHEQKERISNT